MKTHPLDHALADLFPVDLETYPENMQAHIAGMRRLEARRRVIGRVIATLYYSSVAILMLLVAWFLAQALDRDAPIRAKVVVQTPEVRPGDKFKMEVTVDRKRQCDSRTIFQLYDGEANRKTIDLDWQPPRGPAGLDKPFVRSIVIPRDFVPGRARLRIERQFRCVNNFFHQLWPIVLIDPDISFVVLPPNDP